MKNTLASLLLLCGLLLTRAAVARDAWEYEWTETRSPHFVVLSALGSAEGSKLALSLEEFRFAAKIVTNTGRFEERVPTYVYLVPRTDADLGFGRWVLGYLRPTMRANYAVLAPDRQLGTEVVLKHEYAHFLMRNRDRTIYPAWYEEGFAELVSSLHMDGDAIALGKAVDSRLGALGAGDWIGFARLIAVRHTADLRGMDQNMFYAQSWLLTHYLSLGREGRDFAADTQRYLQLNDAGTPAEEAFEQAYDERVTALERKLRHYARRQLHYVVLRVKESPAAVAMQHRALSRAEAAAQLAQLSLMGVEFDAAQRAAEAALALEPGNTLALAVLGDVHKFARRFDAAEPLYRQALELAPDDALRRLDFGEYWLDRARLERDPAGRGRLLVEARRHFARAQALDADIPELYAMNGASYLFAGEDIGKGIVSLERAYAMLPSDKDIVLTLAKAYTAAGRKADAAPLLRTIVARSRGVMAAEARRLLGEELAAGE